MIKKNLGNIDRILRLVVTGIILYQFNQGGMNGIQSYFFGLIALVFFITAFIGFCPLYLPFKMNTNENEKK